MGNLLPGRPTSNRPSYQDLPVQISVERSQSHQGHQNHYRSPPDHNQHIRGIEEQPQQILRGVRLRLHLLPLVNGRFLRLNILHPSVLLLPEVPDSNHRILLFYPNLFPCLVDHFQRPARAPRDPCSVPLSLYSSYSRNIHSMGTELVPLPIEEALWFPKPPSHRHWSGRVLLTPSRRYGVLGDVHCRTMLMFVHRYPQDVLYTSTCLLPSSVHVALSFSTVALQMHDPLSADQISRFTRSCQIARARSRRLGTRREPRRRPPAEAANFFRRRMKG